jgi:hypothetical protein
MARTKITPRRCDTGEVEGETEGEGEGEEEEEGDGKDDEVEDRDLNGRGERKRAEDTAAVVLPASLLQVAASSPPPRLSPDSPRPQHVDVKWVEGQGERCTRSKTRKPSGTVWRCSSAAVPGRVQCAHHAEQSNAGGRRARQRLAGSLLPVPAGDTEGDAGAGVGDGGGGGGGGETPFHHGSSHNPCTDIGTSANQGGTTVV